MRACRIGRAAPEPRVRAKPRSQSMPGPGKAAAGQRNTTIMSCFPTCKGDLRMEMLRHLSHRPLATMLDADPAVVHWTTKVASLELPGGHLFKPNFLVVERCRHVALRVLRSEQMRDAQRDERHRLVKATYAERGVTFEVRSEEDIKADPFLPVAKEIVWHRLHPVPQEVLLQIGTMVSAPPRTLGVLHARLGGGPDTWPMVVALIGRGCIEIPRADRLCADTRVLACRMGG